MPMKPQRPCAHAGCSALTLNGYCDAHVEDRKKVLTEQNRRRGSAQSRGYTSRWQRYSAVFLAHPDHVFCSLRLSGCTIIAKCVDHIDPPTGPSDPKFWDVTNHQPACIRCNSVKGHTKLRGNGSE